MGVAAKSELTTDLGKLTKETEDLLEQVVRDFAYVPIEDRRNGKNNNSYNKPTR